MGCFTLGSNDKYIDSLINASVLCRSGFFQEQKGASSSPSCQAEGQEPGSKCSSNWTFTAVYAQVCVVITAAAASVVVVHRVLLSGGRVFCVSVHTCPATQGANGYLQQSSLKIFKWNYFKVVYFFLVQNWITNLWTVVFLVFCLRVDLVSLFINHKLMIHMIQIAVVKPVVLN